MIINASRCNDLSKILQNQCTCTTSTVANTNTSNLTALFFQNTQQCGNNSGTAGSQWMSQGDSASMEIDLIFCDSQQLHVRQSDNAESLVDFKSINLLLCHLGLA